MTLCTNIQSKRIIGLKPVRVHNQEESVPDFSFENEHSEKIDEDILMKSESLEAAFKIIKDAEKKADLILFNAQKEAESIKTRAFEEGSERGYSEGYIKGESEGYQKSVEDGMVYLDQCRLELSQAKQIAIEYLEDIPCELFNTIKNAISKITCTELEGSEEKIYPIIYSAINDLKAREHIIIRVHPTNVNVVEAKLPELNSLSLNTTFKIIGDLKLELLDCIVETEKETVEFKVSEQLSELFAEIESVIKYED